MKRNFGEHTDAGLEPDRGTMSWDYGQEDQIAAEYDAAMKAGFCWMCAVHKPEKPGRTCEKCKQEQDEAREESDRFDAEDHAAGLDS